MQIVSAATMRELDRRATTEAGIAPSTLMENAGAAVAREALALLERLGRRNVHIVCGVGSNGGDGYVAARHLHLAGLPVTTRLVGDPDRMTGDALANRDLAVRAGVPANEHMTSDSLIVDALLGTGAHGPPREPLATVIRDIMDCGAPILSVDAPTGVDVDTGAVASPAIRAEVTVTFGLPKPGLLVHPGAAMVGRLVVDPIGFPWSTLTPRGVASWYTVESARGALPRRDRTAHKGHFGHVLVMGGSTDMPGAPSLAALGAIRAGAGLVTLAVPDCIHAIAASRAAEPMCLALPSQSGGLAPSPTEELETTLARMSVLCIGPGASRTSEAKAAIKQVLSISTLPRVVDADGLAAYAETTTLVRDAAPTVLTPHPGECARMLGTTVEAVQANRFAAAREAAQRFGATVVLKGAGTIVAWPSTTNGDDPELALVTTGNPGMATGGSGDVLSGVIAALVGQHVEPQEAACLGAYLHGRAGDLTAAVVGEASLCAGDIVRFLPDAIKEVAT